MKQGLWAFLLVAILVGTAGAGAPDKVMIGASPVLSSAGIFIAMERGYFAEEGIAPDTITFASSGAQMLPSLIKGDLDVGGGNINSGIYNAFNDGHGIRIVADKIARSSAQDITTLANGRIDPFGS